MLSAVLLTLVAAAAAAPADTSPVKPISIVLTEEPKALIIQIPLLEFNIAVDETSIGKTGQVTMAREDSNVVETANMHGTWSLDSSELLKVSLLKDSLVNLPKDDPKNLNPGVAMNGDTSTPELKSISFRLANFADNDGKRDVITIKSEPSGDVLNRPASLDYGGETKSSSVALKWTYENKSIELSPK